jgi:ATP-dependent DNA ligase
MVEGGFNACQSAIMSEDGEPDFFYFAFDWHDTRLPDAVFEDRLMYLTDWSEAQGHERLHVVEHVLISNAAELQAYEERCIADGFEGTMIRDPQGPYKAGRATEKQGWLLKLKRFEDAEAVVVGAVERMHNDNEQTRDELGRAKRSHAQEGKRPAGDLGALVCRAPGFTETFEIGTGFTAQQRIELWEEWKLQGISGAGLLGHAVKFKYQPHGTKDRPRSPVFLGFRHEDDL